MGHIALRSCILKPATDFPLQYITAGLCLLSCRMAAKWTNSKINHNAISIIGFCLHDTIFELLVLHVFNLLPTNYEYFVILFPKHSIVFLYLFPNISEPLFLFISVWHENQLAEIWNLLEMGNLSWWMLNSLYCYTIMQLQTRSVHPRWTHNFLLEEKIKFMSSTS